MPDLLLELFSEEIPARMQGRAADDLRRLVTDGLVAAGLVYEGAKAFATPRRLALTVQGLPARSQDVREEKKGPRVGAPEQALAGFLKGAGLSDIAQARIVGDKKGDFYVADVVTPGRPTEAIIAEVVTRTIQTFPWPKSMRWGAGSLRWVRPLHSIVCTFGPETEDPIVVPVEVGGVRAGDVTWGHRFLAPGPIRVRRFDDYLPALERAKVVLDPERRRDIILHDARDLAFASGLELVEDAGLLEEVAGLVEWPVVLMGDFDASFLQVPDEAVRATIRANQKCFVLRDPKSGKLANRFILVSNMAAGDGGATIVAGNERVIRARLSDAKFFYEQDLALPLEARLPRLEAITFHEKLGTQAERVQRIAALARELAPLVGADPEKAERAARLAKADLVTGMVGEFPELQGLMGRRYAEAQGEDADVAAAIEEHYKPVGPGDRVPTAPVSVAVALADKLDTLVGFWAIDEKPTGSKDPYALRRAALGVIRIVLENGLRVRFARFVFVTIMFHISRNVEAISPQDRATLSLDPVALEALTEYFEEPLGRFLDLPFFKPLLCVFGMYRSLLLAVAREIETGNFDEYREENEDDNIEEQIERLSRFRRMLPHMVKLPYLPKSGISEMYSPSGSQLERGEWPRELTSMIHSSLQAFLVDRLKVQLREQGARHDLVDAVFALGNQDDLVLIVRRVEALGAFLATEDGTNLLAGYRRAVNILKAEEKRGTVVGDAVDVTRLVEPAELKLAEVVLDAAARARGAVEVEDFAGAMSALAALRKPVDAFFDAVLVNAEDETLRANRLALLARIRDACHQVADFSRIAG